MIRISRLICLWHVAVVAGLPSYAAEPPSLMDAEIAQSISSPNIPKGFYLPRFTLSPDAKYGVLVPTKNWLGIQGVLPPLQNCLVEAQTGRVITAIQAETAFEGAHMGHMHIKPCRWSSDSSLVLWEADCKFAPCALVLIKLQNGAAKWQVNIVDRAWREMLTRTRQAAPKRYLAAAREYEKANSALNVKMDSRGAFHVNVRVQGEVDSEGQGEVETQKGASLSLPLKVHAELTTNPKQIDWFPKQAQLDSRLDGAVSQDGKFNVTHFSLREEPFGNAMAHSWKEITAGSE